MDYYKFYIQKDASDAVVKELGADFGFYETESKFYGGWSVKDVAKRDWPDEDGDDEYVPTDLKLKAYDMQVKFGYKGDKYSANEKLSALQEYLCSGTMRIYDSYNAIGRQGVRFASIDDDAELVRDDVDGDILIISVKLKVNDPRTAVEPVWGADAEQTVPVNLEAKS